jgi:hypothetical protein
MPSIGNSQSPLQAAFRCILAGIAMAKNKAVIWALRIGIAVGFGAYLAWLLPLPFVFVYTILIVALFTYTVRSAARTRAVAKRMSTHAAPVPEQTRRVAPQIPPLRFENYSDQELPPLPFPYQDQVTADRNIVGVPPLRILYLYNFFSVDCMLQKLALGWRRIGPVYYLSNPEEIIYGQGLLADTDKLADQALVPTPELFDTQLATASTTPLPPGHPDLKGHNAFLSGAYPVHHFLCSDGSWQYGVRKLMETVDVIVMDAAGYGKERGGLGWEIQYLIDHVPAHRFVVLSGEETDMPALEAVFRNSWASMAEQSPNTQPAEGVIRFVRAEPFLPEQSGEVAIEQPDPLQLRPKLNFYARKVFQQRYPDLLREERIMGLLLPQSTKGP